jgi:ABC-2 type transport system ATP-binding protein
MVQESDSSSTGAAVADDSGSRAGGPLAIQVDALSKTYSEGMIFRKRFEALKNVSLSVREGEIFGLLGPNGAGKTTFLKILLGIIRKTSGQATMLGLPAGSREGRRKVGFLPEHLRVPQHMTGYQALEFFGNLSNLPTRRIREKRGELLELVGLADRAKDGVKQYSKGMLQRLGLAQALLHDPKLLVLDEPTDGLDPRARAEMREIIRKLQERGVTIFLNSHLLQEVEMVCQRVAILDKGHLRYCGAVDQIGAFVNQQNLALQDSPDAAPGAGSSAASSHELVVVRIQGDAEAVNQCFQGIPFELKGKQGNEFLVEVDLKTQEEVDGLVDRLRAQQISLISLERRRVTLEDAFLQIVDEQSSKN